MEIKRNCSNQLVTESYDIIGLTSADMHEMSLLFKRCMEIRVNHITSDKKEYITDDELLRIEAVLDCLTEGHRVELKKSVFEGKKESIEKSNEILRRMKQSPEKPTVDPVVEWDDQAVAEQTSKGQPV